MIDSFWVNEYAFYDYKANISCIGSRSNYAALRRGSIKCYTPSVRLSVHPVPPIFSK